MTANRARRQAKLARLATSPAAMLYDGSKGVFLSATLPLVGKAPSDLTEWLNLLSPDSVCDAHRKYVEAGSRVIQTNSFNGNRFRLRSFEMEDRVTEINAVAAHLARGAAGAGDGSAVAVGVRPAFP